MSEKLLLHQPVHYNWLFDTFDRGSEEMRARFFDQALKRILHADSPLEAAQKVLQADSPEEAALKFIQSEEQANRLLELLQHTYPVKSERKLAL